MILPNACGRVACAFRALPRLLRGRVAVFAAAPAVPQGAASLWLAGMMAALAVAAAVGTLLWDWLTGTSESLAAAGFYPVSDANGYQTCATGLIDLGHFPYDEWCNRRPIYPSLLASFFMVSGRYAHIALLVQALVVALSVAALAREAVRLVGVSGALAALGILLLFCRAHNFPLMMTENAGLSFGALALAAMLRGAETGRLSSAYLGIGLLSVALNARAGAYFILPVLVLWGGLLARSAGRRVAVGAAGALGAVVSGFVLALAITALGGGSPSGAQGNFSYTLYGLSAGGGGWARIYTDHPEIASLPSDREVTRAIYGFAWHNIERDPVLLLRTLARNFFTYLELAPTLSEGVLFDVAGLRRETWGTATQVLWWLGALAMLRRWREPRFALLIVLQIGCLLSGPVIVQDGGIRVFAASIAVDVLQVAAGIWAVITIVLPYRPRAPPPAARNSSAVLCLAASLLAGVVAPFTPLRHLAALAPLTGPECGAGEVTVLTRLGQESVALVITAAGLPTEIYPPRVATDRIHRGLGTLWYAPGIDFPPPATLVLGYQRREGDPLRGTTGHYVAFRDLTADFGKLVRLCYPANEPLKEPNTLPYHVLTSVTPLDAIRR